MKILFKNYTKYLNFRLSKIFILFYGFDISLKSFIYSFVLGSVCSQPAKIEEQILH